MCLTLPLRISRKILFWFTRGNWLISKVNFRGAMRSIVWVPILDSSLTRAFNVSVVSRGLISSTLVYWAISFPYWQSLKIVWWWSGCCSLRETIPRYARIILVVSIRRFLCCYAVTGNLLRNVMTSHFAILCSHTNDRTTREAIALTRSTSTWWWTLQDVHHMAVW